MNDSTPFLRFLARAATCLTAAVALFLSALAVQAQEKEPVDLELILMVDASGSVDHDEFTLQRYGYITAFRNPRVASAIRSGPHGKIAVSYVEWTGPFLQTPVVDWTVLSDPASIEAFVQVLERTPRQLYTGGTAVGHAILYGANSIAGNRFQGTRRVIDVSGDGPTNRGIPAALARDQVVAQGFTVNGLPILTDYSALEGYYLDNVIGGPGAFVIPARSFQDFNAAILTKLIREIADIEDAERVQAASARGPLLVTGNND